MSVSIEVTAEALTAFEKVSKKEHKWAIFKADDAKEKCLVDCQGEIGSTFDDFKAALPDVDPRYVFSKEMDLIYLDGESSICILRKMMDQQQTK